VIAGLVATLIIVPFGGGRKAYAATPPVLAYSAPAVSPGGPVLHRIAAAAKRLPAPTAIGRYRYLRTEGWGLNSAIGGGHVTSALVSGKSESWLLPNGHGRTRSTTGESLVDRVGSKETLNAVLAKPGSKETFPGRNGEKAFPLLDLSALDYARPRAFADEVQSNTGNLGAAGIVDSVGVLFGDEPLPPATRAKVWNMLATVSGVTYRGKLTDRVGRTGDAVTLNYSRKAYGLPGRYLLIIDPNNGQLLEFDDILTTDPGKLNVRVPAVLELTVYLAAGRVPNTHTRPSTPYTGS
jgi:hypothetical protein